MWTNESRRSFLKHSGLGLGWLAAMDLFRQTSSAADPVLARRPHLPATARRVIHLFMQGGPSHIDTFDPKPLLNRLDGQRPPASFGDEDFQNGKFQQQALLGSKRTFTRHGPVGAGNFRPVSSDSETRRRPRGHSLQLSRGVHSLPSAIPDS